MAIISTQGDLLQQHDVDAIVNCVGVMGKGIALQFKKKWPANFKAYAAACKAKQVKLGEMYIYDLGGLATPRYIINFPTKDHWRNTSKLQDIENGLHDLIHQIKILGIQSVAIPPLGCGNGGLSWTQVEPLIEQSFAQLRDVEIRLFKPANNAAPLKLEVNTPVPKMTPGRAAILALLETYQAFNYGLSKIEVQKLTYFLQEAGENLKLTFVKHNYGPYSNTLRHVLDRMDGHYIEGVGDGVVESEITPKPVALNQAKQFLEQADSDIQNRIAKVAELIEGFQSPYGMELLASVHWVAKQEGASNSDEALAKIQSWNPRKKQIMQTPHVASAWTQLKRVGWFT